MAPRTTCLSMTFSTHETLSGITADFKTLQETQNFASPNKTSDSFEHQGLVQNFLKAHMKQILYTHTDRERYASASQCQPRRHQILNKDDQSCRLPPPIMEDLTLCRNNLPYSTRTRWAHDGSVFVLLLFTRVIESEQHVSVPVTKSKAPTIPILF